MFTYHLTEVYQVWSILRFFWLVTGFLWGLLGFRFHLAPGTSFQIGAQLCRSPTFFPHWLITWLVSKLISTLSIVGFTGIYTIVDISWIENKKTSHKKLQQVFAKVINIKLVLHLLRTCDKDVCRTWEPGFIFRYNKYVFNRNDHASIFSQ